MVYHMILNAVPHAISSVQSLNCVLLFVTPWIAAHQASLSITNSRSSLRLTSIESVMPSSHLILCCPLLLLPPIPSSSRAFSNESTLCTRWPKYWSFSLSIIPSKEIPGLIIWSCNSTPGHKSRENYNSKRCIHSNVHCSTPYNSQYMEATQISIDIGMDKEDVVYLYNGILLSHKKNEIGSNMDGPRDFHTKWSQSDRERQISYDVIYIWSLKKW